MTDSEIHKLMFQLYSAISTSVYSEALKDSSYFKSCTSRAQNTLESQNLLVKISLPFIVQKLL